MVEGFRKFREEEKLRERKEAEETKSKIDIIHVHGGTQYRENLNMR